MNEWVFYRLFQRLSDYYILPKTCAQHLLRQILRALNKNDNDPAPLNQKYDDNDDNNKENPP